MKTKIFSTVLLMLISYANYAQLNKVTKDSLAAIRTRYVTIICSLDSVQSAAVLQINRQFLKKSDSAFSTKQLSVQKENKITDAKKWYHDQLKEVLTKKQYDLFKKEEKRKEEEWEKEMKKRNIKFQKLKDVNG